MELSLKDKEALLTTARSAIMALNENVNPPKINYENFPNLKINAGAFVTLKYLNQLRGCIGYIISQTPLIDTVANAAIQAAVNDPRFLPVKKEEMKNITIEISVLSPPVSISDYNEIILSKHGLILNYKNYRSLLLPQVAVEHNFTVEQFLSALFEKAGLDSALWRKDKFNIQTFTAEVFSEDERRNENE